MVLTRHLRRLRAIYPRRRDRLIGSLSRHLPQATPTGVRALNMLIDDAELERRRAAWTPPARKDYRGYRRLYEEHVLQANEGCDLDFLRGRSPVVSDAPRRRSSVGP